MNQKLEQLKEELNNTKKQIHKSIPAEQNFNTTHSNWSYPGLSKEDIDHRIDRIIEIIDEDNYIDINDYDEYLDRMIASLQYMNSQTIPNTWNNVAQGLGAILPTLDNIKSLFAEDLQKENKKAEISAALRKSLRETRAMEARLKELSPRIEILGETLDRIESVREAATSLPTDLDDLNEARLKIKEITSSADKNQAHIAIKKDEADLAIEDLRKVKEEAEATLEKCLSAYRSATSQGLAAAFSERSNSLSWSMWTWVGGLITALGLGGFFGPEKLEKLSQSLTANAAGEIIFLNLVLAILSIGAPIWFAWISTKQINQRFKLAEDYAFKASISRAYEGYRSEAARLDKKLEISLLESALSRLDELPLRLVEPTNHGSPMHELISSDSIRKALSNVPSFTEKVIKLADDSLTRLASGKPKEPEEKAHTKDDE